GVQTCALPIWADFPDRSIELPIPPAVRIDAERQLRLPQHESIDPQLATDQRPERDFDVHLGDTSHRPTAHVGWRGQRDVVQLDPEPVEDAERASASDNEVPTCPLVHLLRDPVFDQIRRRGDNEERRGGYDQRSNAHDEPEQRRLQGGRAWLLRPARVRAARGARLNGSGRGWPRSCHCMSDSLLVHDRQSAYLSRAIVSSANDGYRLLTSRMRFAPGSRREDVALQEGCGDPSAAVRRGFGWGCGRSAAVTREC